MLQFLFDYREQNGRVFLVQRNVDLSFRHQKFQI